MESKTSPVVPPETHVTAQVRKAKHPLSVTFLTLGVLCITVVNLVRFILSLRYWFFLRSQPGLSPLYLAISGFVWAVTGGLLVWGLWRPARWAPRLLEATALTYSLYYWLDLLFVRDHPVSSPPLAMRSILPINWQFSAILTVFCLVYIAWTVGRSKVKAYFDQVLPELSITRSEALKDNDS